MFTPFKGLVATLAFATSFSAVGQSASADTLAQLGLRNLPQQCDLRLTRSAMRLDLEEEETLHGVIDVFCGCEIVSTQMLEYLRRHEKFEVLLNLTAAECPGLSNVLTNVQTASVPSVGGNSEGPADFDSGGTVSSVGGGNGGSTGGNTGGGTGGNTGGGNGGNTGGGTGGNTGGGNGGNTGGGNGGNTGGGNGGNGGNGGSSHGGHGGGGHGGHGGGGHGGGGDRDHGNGHGHDRDC